MSSVSKDFNADEESVIIRMLQTVAVPLFGNMCHVFMNGLNRVQVCGIGLFVIECLLKLLAVRFVGNSVVLTGGFCRFMELRNYMMHC